MDQAVGTRQEWSGFVRYLPGILLLTVLLLLWRLVVRWRSNTVNAAAMDDLQPIVLPDQRVAPTTDVVENQVDGIHELALERFSGEEIAMESSLSREELGILLGADAPATEPSETADELTRAGCVAAQALQEFLSTSEPWVAGDPIIVGWDSLVATQVLPSHSTLVVVETKVFGGSIYVVSTNLTACSLDDLVMQTGYIESNEVTFLGWRRAVECLVASFYSCLASHESSPELNWRSLAPRRWNPHSGGVGLGEQPKATGLAIPFYYKDEPSITLLMPMTVLETLGANAFKPGREEGSTAMGIELVAEIPLQLSATLSLGSQSVKQVAAWEPGALVPLWIQAGQEVDLAVNGKVLARGRIITDASGNLSVQINSILPSAPDVG